METNSEYVNFVNVWMPLNNGVIQLNFTLQFTQSIVVLKKPDTILTSTHKHRESKHHFSDDCLVTEYRKKTSKRLFVNDKYMYFSLFFCYSIMIIIIYEKKTTRNNPITTSKKKNGISL